MKRNEQNDFDFIKDKFEKSYPATPDSLSEDAINQLLLSKQEPKVIKLKPKYNVKAIVSAAAGLLLFLGIMYAAYTGGLFSGNRNKVGNFEKYNEVNVSSTFSDSDDIKSTYEEYAVLDSALDRMGWDPIDGMGGDGGFDIQFVDKGENVQEPGRIKCDGEYVYRVYYNSVRDEHDKDIDVNRIYIFKANGGKPELVSVINCEAKVGDGYSDAFGVMMNNLYIYNDRLIVELMVSDSKSSYEYKRDCNKSVIQIYDISDKSAPKLISEFEQSGRKISSQMIGKYLYTVSHYYASEEMGKYKFPSCGKLNQADLIPAQNISVFDNSYDAHYVVVSAIDVESAEKVSDAKAVLGASNCVFFCDDDLYIIDYTYGLDIIRAELNEGRIEFSEKARVDGYFDFRIQLVESNGLLFISSGDSNFVLNEELEVIYETEEYTEENCINTVRFDGNLLYTVTRDGNNYEEGYEYELKIINLSDTQNLSVIGEATLNKDIKQIIPVDDYLLCIGETYGYNSGIMSLIDVSDKSAPKMLDVKEFDGDLRLDIYKHFVFNSEKGYFAIPCYSDGENVEYGIITFEIVNGKIEITNQFVNENAADFEDLICIGDYLYCFDLHSDEPVNKIFTISAYKYE